MLRQYAEASFTRPTNATPYTIADAVNDSASAPTAMEFTISADLASMGCKIAAARLTKSGTGTTGATFRLWLYRAEPSVIPLDNVSIAFRYADRATRIGYVDFTTALAGTDCVVYVGTFLNTQGVALKMTGQVLYGLLEVRGAYTPANAENFHVALDIEQG